MDCKISRQFPTPRGLSSAAYLTQLCQQSLPWRYGDPPERVCRQLHYELAVIDRAGLANYFLIVWDIVRFARSQGIRCQGRGSAANSLVAYLLAISPIDPLATTWCLSAFSPMSGHPCRILTSILRPTGREEVIQYVYRALRARSRGDGLYGDHVPSPQRSCATSPAH